MEFKDEVGMAKSGVTNLNMGQSCFQWTNAVSRVSIDSLTVRSMLVDIVDSKHCHPSLKMEAITGKKCKAGTKCALGVPRDRAKQARVSTTYFHILHMARDPAEAYRFPISNKTRRQL
ncbi:hypothetical protein Pmani_000102 [Petrolisthes manimaculis]|uniref:Uncharacterized protein n=1 Tax=Petrolisthes manimaculis TaxID=1843537 RepID=A0AAE1U835_9EUCA|nr:hypothetical protein Pmani_014693 [Petrolisthes manimaculis]KAK4329553.1 hypothetical protein Pmani_000102 [Petrolisthes manimaculis]